MNVIDPYFIPKPGFIGFRNIDPRFFLLSDEDFMNRYKFDMTNYGLHGEEVSLYWRNGLNIPRCNMCNALISDSDNLRRKYGWSFCPDCFKLHTVSEALNLDKRKRLEPRMVYFLRVAGILNGNTVSSRRLEEFNRKCKNAVANK